MNTAVAQKKQTAFRLDGDLLERLRVKARRENRSLNNYVERVLMAVAYDEPNEITIAAMKEAMTGGGEELDLARWDEFIASLQPMWKLIPTEQFKKDLKRYRNKPEKLASLKSVLDLLQENGEVPHEYGPHMLKSNYKGFMECHVENDFLLIWRDVDTQTISLVRIGTHSELFKR